MKINITSDLKALLTKKGVNSKQFIELKDAAHLSLVYMVYM